MRLVPIFLLVLGAACGKPAKLELGKAAPELPLETLLQAPSDKFAGLSSLRGKAVVVEFWATWCDPCVEQIPHLNRLAERYADKPVVFLAVTDEPRAKIEAFLKDHPIKGWVAVEAKAAFDAYRIRSRPRTLLLDPKGRIAAVTYPGFMREDDIDNLLAGKPVSQGPGRGGLGDLAENEPAAPSAKNAGAPLFEARVSQAAQAEGSSYVTSETRFSAKAMDPRLLTAAAFGVPETRVVLQTPPQGSYDVEVSVPEGAEVFPVLREALLAAFRLKLKKQKRAVEAWVLSGGGKLKAARRNGKFGFSEGRGRITASGMTLADLALALENDLAAPVVDETGLSGRYEFELDWKPGESQTLVEALKTRLGIRAAKAKRPVELLVFSAVPEPSPKAVKE